MKLDWTPLDCEADLLGESPFWHPHEQMLYWVDIPGRRIRRMAPGGGTAQDWPMPSEPGCIAPTKSGGLVVALRDGIYRAPAWLAPLAPLHRFDHDPATTRANDGKVDALGRFWVGTMFEPRTTASGALYMLDARPGVAGAGLRRMATGVTTANGLAWSPDQRTIYWADTPTHAIRCWDWDAVSGAMTAERVFHRFDAKPAGWESGMSGYRGRPDGATVDAQGRYHAAMYEGQRLCQLAPDGRLLAELALPAQCPTMPCFGGPDLRTLFVTSARHGRGDEELRHFPGSGKVWTTRVEVPGLPVRFFDDGPALGG